MKGIRLGYLTGNLEKVDEAFTNKPSLSIENPMGKLGPHMKWIKDRFDNFNFKDQYHRLPLKILRVFSFDELCKLHASSVIMMDRTITDLFEKSLKYEVVRKIKSSKWRWGPDEGNWNDLVDAYNSIREFRFIDNPDFTITLDYTTHFNEMGYSKFSRTFIDGVFAYLVHYKGKHVMTIGFSIIGKRRVLIQQIQTTQRTGNRFLFKLPGNYVEFVVDIFMKNFPGHAIYLADGGSLSQKILRNYRRSFERTREARDQYRGWVKNGAVAGDSTFDVLQMYERDCEDFVERIKRLEDDIPRIEALYNNTGRFERGELYESNWLAHHRMVLRKRARRPTLKKVLEAVLS